MVIVALGYINDAFGIINLRLMNKTFEVQHTSLNHYE